MEKINNLSTATNPLVSIIIPTYNRALLLKETLQSIIEQSYSNIEIVIISDGCNDNTYELVKELNDQRIKFIDIGYNSKLPAKVRNLGLQIAQGDYIAFCDDDDLWEASKIEKQVNALLNSKASLCFTNFSFLYGDKIITKDLKILQRRILSPLLSYGFKSIMLFTNIIITSSVMINKNRTATFFFNESPFLRASEDYDYWIRILAKNKAIYLKDSTVQYRIHSNRITTTSIDNLKRGVFVISTIKDGYPRLTLKISKYIMDLRIFFGEIRNS